MTAPAPTPGDRVQADGRTGIVVDVADDWVTLAVDQCGHVTAVSVPMARVRQSQNVPNSRSPKSPSPGTM